MPPALSLSMSPALRPASLLARTRRSASASGRKVFFVGPGPTTAGPLTGSAPLLPPGLVAPVAPACESRVYRARVACVAVGGVVARAVDRAAGMLSVVATADREHQQRAQLRPDGHCPKRPQRSACLVPLWSARITHGDVHARGLESGGQDARADAQRRATQGSVCFLSVSSRASHRRLVAAALLRAQRDLDASCTG